MAQIVTFTDGATALLREPDQVPNRLRDPIKDAQMTLGVFGIDIEDMPEGKDKQRAAALMVAQHPKEFRAVDQALILALVQEWSYPFPVSADGLGELPGHAYDALKAACEPKLTEIFPSFKYVKASEDGGEDSPTVPSGD